MDVRWHASSLAGQNLLYSVTTCMCRGGGGGGGEKLWAVVGVRGGGHSWLYDTASSMHEERALM